MGREPDLPSSLGPCRSTGPQQPQREPTPAGTRLWKSCRLPGTMPIFTGTFTGTPCGRYNGDSNLTAGETEARGGWFVGFERIWPEVTQMGRGRAHTGCCGHASFPLHLTDSACFLPTLPSRGLSTPPPQASSLPSAGLRTSLVMWKVPVQTSGESKGRGQGWSVYPLGPRWPQLA